MRHIHRPPGIVAAAVVVGGLALSGCGSISIPGLSNPEPPPVPEAPAELPSRYTPEEFVGRWGFAAYHKEPDRVRTEAAARGQCRQPYVIARGPSGGIMMHLADQAQPSELRLKGGPGGRNYIGPPGPAGGAQDREILSFDGRVLITRYVDPDAASRYGNMVHVRCGPRA
jgi:hypothetical protein